MKIEDQTIEQDFNPIHLKEELDTLTENLSEMRDNLLAVAAAR